MVPLANMPETEVEKLPPTLPTGVYFGWAHLAGTTYPMVMSIGWNPFYKNSKKTAVRGAPGAAAQPAHSSLGLREWMRGPRPRHA